MHWATSTKTAACCTYDGSMKSPHFDASELTRERRDVTCPWCQAQLAKQDATATEPR